MQTLSCPSAETRNCFGKFGSLRTHLVVIRNYLRNLISGRGIIPMFGRSNDSLALELTKSKYLKILKLPERL